MSDFFEELNNAVTLRAHGNSSFRLQAFAEEAAQRLEDAEVAFDLTVVPLNCVGRNRKKLQLLGYAEDPADSSLVVLCGVFFDADDARLAPVDARSTFGSAVAFIEQSADGYLEANLEISSAEAEHARYFREVVAREPRSSLARVERFKFILITDGVMSEKLRKLASDEVCGRPASYSIWDINRFQDLALSESGQDEYTVELAKWLPDGLACLPAADADAATKSYLAVIPGKLLADVYNEYGSQLLESNVRTFLSARGKVNRGIQRTLKEEPEKFLAFNNGLTTTATGIEVHESAGGPRITAIHNWQIVNGGQTTASIAHFLRGQSGAALEDVYVPMKLVTVDRENASELVSSISRYANSQNAVSEADLFSNSPFHVRLEQISRRLLAPAVEGHQFQSKWFYERARGQWENQRNAGPVSHVKRFDLEFPKKQRITKTDWAKYAFSWSQRPHEVSRGAQSNFMAYAKIAAEQWEKDPEAFGDAYFRQGVAKAIIFAETRAGVLAADWYSTGYLANIVTYAVARFAYELSIRFPGRKYDLEAVWRRQSVSAASLNSLVAIAQQMQAVLTDPNRPQANVTQWAKQEAAWTRAKQRAVNLDSAVEYDLIDVAEARSQQVEAKRERQIDSGLEAVTRIMKIRRSVWADVLSEASGSGVLSPTDLDILGLVMSGRVPTDRQAQRALRALERCVDEGIADRGVLG